MKAGTLLRADGASNLFAASNINCGLLPAGCGHGRAAPLLPYS